MWRLCAVVSLFLLGAVWIARAADPDALWKIVHDKCVPDQEAHASPAPCESVALSEGYVILKDIRGATQFLLIPTARITGIESPAIWAPDAPNYVRLAWEARDRVSARAGHHLPDDAISLAINSEFGRTQNQLHIHIDCLLPDVQAALASNVSAIGSRWAPFPVALAGRNYRAMQVNNLTENPFALLAQSLADAPAEMPKHTLVVTAAQKGGFILLDDAANLAAGDNGSGEQLQDHECALARSGS
jgi:CDP-diacylglycerol pyrophosphatase